MYTDEWRNMPGCTQNGKETIKGEITRQGAGNCLYWWTIPIQNQAVVAYMPAMGHTPILPLVLHPYPPPLISTLSYLVSFFTRKIISPPGKCFLAEFCLQHFCFSLTIQLGESFAPFNMWPDLITKSKECGTDVIQVYVFSNGHEPVR